MLNAKDVKHFLSATAKCHSEQGSGSDASEESRRRTAYKNSKINTTLRNDWLTTKPYKMPALLYYQVGEDGAEGASQKGAKKGKKNQKCVSLFLLFWSLIFKYFNAVRQNGKAVGVVVIILNRNHILAFKVREDVPYAVAVGAEAFWQGAYYVGAFKNLITSATTPACQNFKNKHTFCV